LSPVGGTVNLVGGTVSVDTTIRALSGRVGIEAASGDLDIGSGAKLDVSGVAKTFYDATEYTSGGALSLRADRGDLNVASGASLDFSGAASGGNAGSVAFIAPEGAVSLAGTLDGRAATGYTGGSFTLDSKAAADLDALAALLATGGNQ